MISRAELREIILNVIGEVDYDIYKSMIPELSDDPDDTERVWRKIEALIQETKLAEFITD